MRLGQYELIRELGRTRAVVSVDEHDELARDPAEVRRLLDHLVQARLLVVQSSEGGSSAGVEIVHVSLIQSLPTLMTV